MEEISEEFRYSTDNAKIGKCLIISNDKFDPSVGHPPRKGAKADVRNLSEVFEHLGFDLEKYENLNRMQMQRILQKVGQEDHSSADCFVCCISTHGSDGQVAACDGDIKLSRILSMFEDDACASLKGKPKLFFIQACRGQNTDSGVLLKFQRPSTHAYDSSEGNILTRQADLLLACATVKDFASWRNVEEGSWFVQELCNVLKKNETDLLGMLTVVNRMVAYKHQSYSNINSSNTGKKQVPCIISTLQKKFYFVKKSSPALSS